MSEPIKEQVTFVGGPWHLREGSVPMKFDTTMDRYYLVTVKALNEKGKQVGVYRDTGRDHLVTGTRMMQFKPNRRTT